MPGRHSMPNPQISAGRTPFRKTIGGCDTGSSSPLGQLKLNDDSIDSLTSDDSEASSARTQRRKTMTPREIRANLSWAGIESTTPKSG